MHGSHPIVPRYQYQGPFTADELSAFWRAGEIDTNALRLAIDVHVDHRVEHRIPLDRGHHRDRSPS